MLSLVLTHAIRCVNKDHNFKGFVRNKYLIITKYLVFIFHLVLMVEHVLCHLAINNGKLRGLRPSTKPGKGQVN